MATQHGAAECYPMRKIFDSFDAIRGDGNGGGHNQQQHQLTSATPFWDVVILTTADDQQRRAYCQQVDTKLQRGEVPPRARYYVIADPPGPKIGSGGSTLYALSELARLEPKWKEMKVLLIHAGGQSQRLPNASVLGKAFTAVPLGRPMYQMLEVKLALYLPFVAKMNPGVFVVCADTFETYLLGQENSWSVNEKGFTAFAYPSPIKIGTKHGVYILDSEGDGLRVGGDEGGGGSNGSATDAEARRLAGGGAAEPVVEMRRCNRVLQKPTVEEMRANGAVVPAAAVGTSGGDINEYVYTDSVFFFDHDVSQKLVDFYHANAPLRCEICAYGDFVQALGDDSTDGYVYNTKNVSHVTPELIATRQKIYALLRGTPLHVLALKKSKFYHIGTMREYLHHLCEDTKFASEMSLSRFCFSSLLDDGDDDWRLPNDRSGSATVVVGRSKRARTVSGCVLHSAIAGHSVVPSSSVVEYCYFPRGVTVGSHCIVSGCSYDVDDRREDDAGGKQQRRRPPQCRNLGGGGSGSQTEEEEDGDDDDADEIDAGNDDDGWQPVVPDNTFLHTVPVKVNGAGGERTAYATACFHVDDDLKRSASRGRFAELSYFGLSAPCVWARLGLDSCAVFDNDNDGCCSLWSMRLFPPESTPSRSLRATLAALAVATCDGDDSAAAGGCGTGSEPRQRHWRRWRALRSGDLLSFADMVSRKDVVTMLDDRDKLHDIIKRQMNELV